MGAKHRESVRLIADQSMARDKKKADTKSMVFLAEGKARPSRTSFRNTQAKSVRMTGSKSVKLTGSLHKMTPRTFAGEASGPPIFIGSSVFHACSRWTCLHGQPI